MGTLPWMLLGLGLLLAAGVVLVRSLPESNSPRVLPPDPEKRMVMGWEVALAAPDEGLEGEGGELSTARVVRLERLHASPERQAFDAAALSRVLDLEGEPWVLVLPPGLVSPACQIRLNSGDFLRPVPPGPHPVQRVLHATGNSQRPVLFGPAPETPVLVLDGVLHPMHLKERPAGESDRALLGGPQ
jgi:hypothetical protein